MISQINDKINLAEKESNQTIANIENEIVVLKETAIAKSKICNYSNNKDRQNKLIELNKKKLIPEK